jgi:hypothetical protein
MNEDEILQDSAKELESFSNLLEVLASGLQLGCVEENVDKMIDRVARLRAYATTVREVAEVRKDGT